jgi:hypothetical protein
MADERNEEEVRVVAVQSLKNELDLAARVLRGIKEARETLAMEAEAVASARSAFRHAVDALGRMPRLEPEDMRVVESLISDFRSALSDLEV